MGDYDRLEQGERQPKRLVDHSRLWEKLEPVAAVNGAVEDRLRAFCDSKRISVDALAALGARIRTARSGAVELVFAGVNGNGAIVALKYRPIGGSSHDSYTEQPSSWLRPIIVGNRDSLDWLIAEGETDGARLYELAGERCAILVLPAGARTFKREWARLIPRGANVGLCHDADEDGDAGADKAAKIIGATYRLRPPIEDGGDWCDWDGGPDQFLELAQHVHNASRFEFVSYREFASREYPVAEPLLGEKGAILLAGGSLFMVYGADGSAKSTWTIDGIVHLAAGVDWLDIPVLRPVRVCIIENEGPPSLFQQKLDAKIAGWAGPDPQPNLYVFAGPWGEFSFADPAARAALNDFCDEHAIDVVTANPTLGLGVAASGRPDETQQFVDWLVECGLKAERAFWLLHHENKAGQISGDWGRHPDTKVALQRDGNRQRTKLDWNKTRWATLEPDEKTVMLEWVLETQGYTVTALDTVGASDLELEQRVADYLTEHPFASTTTVETEVKGTATRIRRVLEGPRFDSMKGKRGAKLWLLASTPSASADDGVTE
jgi:AAA domain-containing protein